MRVSVPIFAVAVAIGAALSPASAAPAGSTFNNVASATEPLVEKATYYRYSNGNRYNRRYSKGNRYGYRYGNRYNNRYGNRYGNGITLSFGNRSGYAHRGGQWYY